MSVYNGEKWLAEAIDSILAQTIADFEFLIVDDGSEDRTAEIARDYEKRDGRISLMTLERNVGKAAARNRAFERAKGAFITLMDDDDVSLPDRLEKQVAFLQANSEIGAVGTSAMFTDEDMNPIRPYEVQMRHAHIVYDILLGRCVVGSSLMWRRQILVDCGGYDETLMRLEDYDLVSRTAKQTRYANLAACLYLYRQHEGQLHSTLWSQRLWAEFMERILIRLWGEAPPASLDRISRARKRQKMNWLDRRGAKRDIKRYIDGLIAAEWVEPADRPYLHGVMNRLLEQTSPRLWQMFCHWRRHRFGRG